MKFPKYLITIFISIILIMFFAVKYKKETIKSPVIDEPNISVATSTGTIDPEPDISTPLSKKRAIDHLMWAYRSSKRDYYKEYNIGDQDNIVVVFYTWQTDEDSGKGGGLVIFKIVGEVPRFIFESDPIPSYSIFDVKSLDMNNDGKNELLVLAQNGKYESLYIYSNSNSSFKILSPFTDNSIVPDFNAADSEIQVSDLDNDKLPEVWFPKTLSDDKGRSIGERYVAYKWDGTKYFLWKEQDKPFGEYNSFRDLK